MINVPDQLSMSLKTPHPGKAQEQQPKSRSYHMSLLSIPTDGDTFHIGPVQSETQLTGFGPSAGGVACL